MALKEKKKEKVIKFIREEIRERINDFNIFYLCYNVIIIQYQIIFIHR